MKAALYLIPVTLGDNSEFELEKSLPPYNAQIIKEIKHFVVENIRSARRFLVRVSKEINIDSLTFFELNEHTDLRQVQGLLEPIFSQNYPVGVISEAGCPAVADPGRAAVSIAHKKNVPVFPLVGPSSILLSVMASGFSGQSFAFCGYLPVKNAERVNRLRQLENRAWNEKQTQVFIEAPYRNLQLFEAILKNCRKDTLLCVASGLTTQTEFIKSMSLAEWKKLPPPNIQKIPTIFVLGSPEMWSAA